MNVLSWCFTMLLSCLTRLAAAHIPCCCFIVQSHTAEGRKSELDNQIRNLKKELQSDAYKGANEKYRYKMIDFRVCLFFDSIGWIKSISLPYILTKTYMVSTPNLHTCCCPHCLSFKWGCIWWPWLPNNQAILSFNSFLFGFTWTLF